MALENASVQEVTDRKETEKFHPYRPQPNLRSSSRVKMKGIGQSETNLKHKPLEALSGALLLTQLCVFFPLNRFLDLNLACVYTHISPFSRYLVTSMIIHTWPSHLDTPEDV